MATPGGERSRGEPLALAFYDDELEHDGLRGWFGFVNSWSENWGDHGIGYIHYRCFLQTILSSYEIVLPPNPGRVMALDAPQGERYQ